MKVCTPVVRLGIDYTEHTRTINYIDVYSISVSVGNQDKIWITKCHCILHYGKDNMMEITLQTNVVRGKPLQILMLPYSMKTLWTTEFQTGDKLWLTFDKNKGQAFLKSPLFYKLITKTMSWDKAPIKYYQTTVRAWIGKKELKITSRPHKKRNVTYGHGIH